jgi:hypothetical protein
MDSPGAWLPGFKDSVNELANVLTGKGITVEKLHLSHYGGGPTGYFWKQLFMNKAPGKDIICFRGDGLIDQWIPGITAFQFWPSFAGTSPFVFALAGSTGNYEDKYYNMVDAFMGSGAAVYIGSTSDSLGEHLRAKTQGDTIWHPYDWHNSYAANNFFKNWQASESIGKAFTKLERQLLLSPSWPSQYAAVNVFVHSYHGGAYIPSTKNKEFWQYWVSSYNLYGDPKFGAASSNAVSSQTVIVAPLRPQIDLISSLDVVVPDYEVDVKNEMAYVEIPGGGLLFEEGRPLVPYYTTSIDYPMGSRVQEVVLSERSGLLNDSGLSIPSLSDSALSSQRDEGWFPHPGADYSWYTVENADGTTTLVITIYAFYYNSLTTDVRFYKNYSFDINYTFSPVTITGLKTNKNVYEQGEVVTVDIELDNSGEAQDVTVSSLIKEYNTERIVDGLLLETLKEFSGPASYSPRWYSNDVEPGYYCVEVTLKDTAENVLSKQTEMFRLGICSGEIVEFTVTPESCNPGDDVEIGMTFSNEGTVSITGSAYIRVLDSTGDLVDEYAHAIIDLLPSESVIFKDVWNAPGLGSYQAVGYVYYDSEAAGPAIVEINVSARQSTPSAM